MSSVIVCGRSSSRVQPDRATLRLAITSVATAATDALAQVSSNAMRLTEVLATHGVPRDQWVTDGVSLADEWEWRNDTNVLVGQRATTSITVTLHDTEQLPSLIASSVADARAKLNGVSWHVDAQHPARHELLGLAAADARRRATAYAAALDLRLGAVVEISEMPLSATTPYEPSGGAAPRMMKANADAADLPTSGGALELAAEVYVRFALLESSR